MRGRLVGLAVLGPIRSADGTSNDSGFENLPIFFLFFWQWPESARNTPRKGTKAESRNQKRNTVSEKEKKKKSCTDGH